MSSAAPPESARDESGAQVSIEQERDPSAPTLSSDRFSRFFAAVRPRLPIGDRVQWVDSTPGGQSNMGVGPRTHRHLLDLTSAGGGATDWDDSASDKADRNQVSRRMFVQALFDASASTDACWHLEIRWNMCRGGVCAPIPARKPCRARKPSRRLAHTLSTSAL